MKKTTRIKRMIFAIIGIVTLLSCIGCGKSYQCYDCKKTTTKAYYDMDADEEWVLCEDCAREYWMPFNYKEYRIK